MTAAMTILTVRLSLDDHHSLHEMASALGQRPSAYLSGLVSLHAAKIQLRLIFAAKGMADPLEPTTGVPSGQVPPPATARVASPAPPRVAFHDPSAPQAAFHPGIPLPVPHPVVSHPTPTIPIRLSLPTSVINVLRASAVDGKAETAALVVARMEAAECRRTRRAAIEEALSSG